MDICELGSDIDSYDSEDEKWQTEQMHQIFNGLQQNVDEGPLSETTEEEQSYDPSEMRELGQEEDYSLEAPSRLTIKDRLVEVAQVSYREFFIKIFTDSLNPRRRFFFEPIVQLDRKQIVIENFGLFQQDVIRFTVQMWNQELRSKVLERLRSLPEFDGDKIHQNDIHVLPFEEVYLVFKPGSIPESVQLINRPISYLRMQTSVNFYLLSNSSSAALELAGDFPRNPEFSLKKWQLTLVGRGLAIGKATKLALSDRPIFSFNVSSVTSTSFQGAAVFGVVPLPTLNQEEEGKLADSKSWSNVVPVFSVKKCSNPLITSGNSKNVTFSIFNFPTKMDHGYFHLPIGTFVVRTPGLYQFHFNGCVVVDSESNYVRVELKVNGVVQATTRSATSSNLIGFQPVALSALLNVKSGESVEICVIGGGIYEDTFNVTHFEGILFVD